MSMTYVSRRQATDLIESSDLLRQIAVFEVMSEGEFDHRERHIHTARTASLRIQHATYAHQVVSDITEKPEYFWADQGGSYSYADHRDDYALSPEYWTMVLAENALIIAMSLCEVAIMSQASPENIISHQKAVTDAQALFLKAQEKALLHLSFILSKCNA